MLIIRQSILLSISMFILLFHVEKTLAANPLHVYEVLSHNTGTGASNVVNQFADVTLDPYNGFAVDSKGSILISDTLNFRILHFSKDALELQPITLNKDALFYPQNICLCDGDMLFVHNTGKQEIVAISSTGEVLSTFSPASVFEANKYKSVPIISLSCGKTMIKVVFGGYEGKGKPISPVYEDEYDQHFKLVNRRKFSDNAAYYKAVREADQVVDKRFTDAREYTYGYPVVQDWYGKFLPLLKYSREGKLLNTIDGPFLTKHTSYSIYDYYTGRDIMERGWGKLRGREFLIVNWYVTPSGTIYALLANNDSIKVLRIQEMK